MLFNFLFLVCTGLAVSNAKTQPVKLTTADINAFLNAHNAARKAVGVPNLKWNSSLSVSAGNYGSQCEWGHSDGAYGENLYSGSPINKNHAALATSAVTRWVSEKAVEDPPAWKCFTTKPTCGHYSQVVWSRTTTVGCAIIHCPDLDNYVLCQYWPPGNYRGQKPY
ncbi:pathogenesis-related protein 1 [Biomphalaria pfeifferi]|uniref:Pathogenesis-related protein 1 n=1 Tax=Biomphalaria pfeifferi TaxID=112525 RepID=A0AAD8BV30_BIOPF|nr:pathogenesis-related protein 1 [Biomphalaria pfeifferi]